MHIRLGNTNLGQSGDAQLRPSQSARAGAGSLSALTASGLTARRCGAGLAAFFLSASGAFAQVQPGVHSDGTGRLVSPENYTAQFDDGLVAAHEHLSSAQLKARAARQAAIANAPRNGYASQFDSRTATPRVLWAGSDSKPVAVPPLASEKAIAETRARDFLARRAAVLGVDAATLASAQLIDVQAPRKGPTIARFQQMYGSTEVFGQRLNVALDHNGNLVSITGGFVADMDTTTPVYGKRSLSGAQALAIGFHELGGLAGTAFNSSGERGGYTLYQRPSNDAVLSLTRDPRTKFVYFPLGNQLIPAYYLELSTQRRDGQGQFDYGYVISAVDGSVLLRKDQIQYENFSYTVFVDSSTNHVPMDSPIGNGYTPYQGTNIYADQARISATQSKISWNNAPMLSTNDPWLASGATVTSGNNVNAYLDLNGKDGYQADGVDFQVSVSAANTFDYPISADAEPATTAAQSAANVNLFYLNNWLHDFWYDHGFDEASGNAQASNYGRGGVEGDPIHAEGQDSSGTDNANMSTPADGGSPRMQMFLWSGPLNGSLDITIPPAAATNYGFGPAAFGPVTYNVPGQLAIVDDGVDPSTDACSAIQNTSAIAGKIAVIDRGTCAFQDKAAAAEAAGAIGAIIVDNKSEALIQMAANADSPPVSIPAVFITLSDGTSLKTALTAGATVTATLVKNPSDPTMLDGTLDNQVIAHEFFHYVSNRLIGDGSGLINNQGGGMGEGWSDFDSMLVTVREEDASISGNDAYQAPYPMGPYVFAALPSYYFGIRRMPYSTDVTVDSMTFKHIQADEPLPTTAPLAYGEDGANNAEVHATGEIWTNMLWEGWVGLMTSGHYTFDEARSRMQDYVIGGLKLTPNNPTFTEARDGVIGAASASSCLDANILSTAFAKRGIGQDAVAPAARSRTNTPVIEDDTPALQNCPPVADAGPDQTVVAGTVVTLDGSSSSDENGDTLKYQWIQTAGPASTLTGGNTVKATFTPPVDGAYVFTLLVTDGAGAFSTDTVTITATAAPAAPASSGSGGGAFGGASLLSLAGLAALARRKKRS